MSLLSRGIAPSKRLLFFLLLLAEQLEGDGMFIAELLESHHEIRMRTSERCRFRLCPRALMAQARELREERRLLGLRGREHSFHPLKLCANPLKLGRRVPRAAAARRWLQCWRSTSRSYVRR